MKKVAVILYGPPGSGKGTQANLLAAKLGLIHFDTGRFLESVVHDPSRRKSKIIIREQRLFDTGKLMTPSFVLKEVSSQVAKIARAGWGVVFSGSPRTMYEALKLLPILEKLFGRNHIFTFILKIPESVSLKRNSRRVVCSVCRAPLLTAYYPGKTYTHCPICAGPFYKRTLDNLETIRVRLQEYHNRTKPIFSIIRRRGYRLQEINGAPPPYKIFKRLHGYLKNARGN